MKYDIFLVDADNTVLDFHASSLRALEEAFVSFGEPWKESYGDIFFALNDELWSALERRELTREKLHEIRFPIYLEKLSVKGISGVEFNKKYLEFLSKSPIYMDGAEEFLKALKRHGRIYIVTNGTEWIQKSRFALSGLNLYIDGAFISECIGFDKPAKEYTDYVLSHIPNFDKARAVWIGDSLSADIAAAKAAGVDCVWFHPREGLGQKEKIWTYSASSFCEILNFLGIN